MSISLITRQAYSEVCEFLKLLPEDEKNVIPKEMREFFKSEQDVEYNKEIVRNIPIIEQELKEETLAIIALLNLKYWCKDEKEKQRLKQIYSSNEKVYQDFFQLEFNPSEIFEKKEIVKEELAVVEHKESLIKKILNKIKKMISVVMIV